MLFILGLTFGVAIMLLAWFFSKQGYENIAERILTERSTETSAQVATQLDPFRRDMENLQKSIIDSTKESVSLKSQVDNISTQANNLATALTDRPKTRGNWGEVMLNKMLEDSGLRKDKDYKLQETLTGTEGERLQPDVVVYLPEKKHIVIDSKLSLLSYNNYIASKSDDDLQAFERSTRKHIDDLAAKNYPRAQPLEAPDFTMMFMPIEGAFLYLMQEKQDLQKYAWNKKIILTSPSLLFAMLQTVAALWRLNNQSQNSEEIARLGGALYDKVAAFDEDMTKFGAQLDKAHRTFDETHRKLSSGKGNILSRIEKLGELGAKTSKQLTSREE